MFSTQMKGKKHKSSLNTKKLHSLILALPSESEDLPNLDDQEFQESAVGDGQYDAFVKAVRNIYIEKLGREFPILTNYAVNIPPGGQTDALVHTTISWDYEGHAIKTRGLDADQTEAAIQATIKMLNIIENL